MQFVMTSLVSDVITPVGIKSFILSFVSFATHLLIVTLEFFSKLFF